MKFFKIAAFLALLLVPALASAQVTNTRIRMRTPTGSNYLINGIAATASAANRTAVFNIGGLAKLSISFSVSRSTATAITMTCNASTDQGTTFVAVADQTVSAGVGTLVAHTWSYAVSASGGVQIDVGVGSYDFLQCVFAATGGGSSDLLTVSAIGGAP